MSDTNVEFADPTLSAYTRGVAKRIANPDAIEKRVSEDAWFIVLFLRMCCSTIPMAEITEEDTPATSFIYRYPFIDARPDVGLNEQFEYLAGLLPSGHTLEDQKKLTPAQRKLRALTIERLAAYGYRGVTFEFMFDDRVDPAWCVRQVVVTFSKITYPSMNA